MGKSLLEHIKSSIAYAKRYNSSHVTAPNVLLWPDPDEQWRSIIERLREEFDALLTFGEYQPEILQGPAIWIKCMVDKTVPDASWSDDVIPIIYLPGISKADFKNIEEASVPIQPLMEYRFTGCLWTQENGREWSVLAFLQNVEQGMGLDVSRDEATKEAILKSLPNILEDRETI